MANPIDELLNRPIPEKLWHYTSIQGFHGIVTGKRMFATDVRFLNDREEFIHAQKIADGIVDGATELDADGFPSRDWLAKAARLASKPPVEIFVISFTAAEDQLSQWRAYSRESSGVSLAFDLRRLRPPAESLALFAPCIYDPIGQKKDLLSDAFRPFMEEVSGYYKRVYQSACEAIPEKKLEPDKARVVKEFLEANPNEQRNFDDFLKAVVDTRIAYMRMAALLKDPAFIEEDEWRLVLPIMMDVPEPLKLLQFRAGKTTLIPYIAHLLSASAPFPLVDIILGPGSDEGSIFAANRLLKSQGLDLKPRLSKVPYRSAW
jgi:hypothetical protein